MADAPSALRMTMMPVNLRVWAVAALVMLAAPASARQAPSTSAGRPALEALTGTWLLAEGDDDVPGDRGPDREGGPPTGRGRPPGGTSAGGTGFPGGMRGGPPDEKEMRLVREVVRRAREASRRLTISQDGERLTITDAEDRTERFTVNGKKEKRLTNDGFVESRAFWEGRQLVVELEPGGGLKLVRRFEVLSTEGQPPQLEISLKLTGGRLPGPFETRRLYDAR